MARDNPPKIRQRSQLERKKTQRASYDRVLIVSEGVGLSRFTSRKLGTHTDYKRPMLKFIPALLVLSLFK